MADETSSARTRPQFRNLSLGQLASYRLPAAGLVSILHRASGVLLFLLLPLLLWLFELSLKSEISFDRLREVTDNLFVKFVLLAVVWAILHHFVAGIRYLAFDLHIAVAKEASQRTALAVFAVSLLLTLIAAWRLFGGI
jgi:succinate dehydrogenase / fumarate reductase cytochrome b subunit